MSSSVLPRWRLIVLGWLLSVMTVGAGAPARVVFTNSIGPLPPEAPAAQPLPPQDLADTQEIEIPLRMRGYPKLLERVGRGESVTAAELQRDYLPLGRDYAQVIRWLRQEGFAITQTDPNRLAVFARGNLAQIQHALQVQMYRVTVKGKVYHAALTHPSLPQAIAGPVLGINGLQPFRQPHRHTVHPMPNIANQPPYLVKEVLGAYGGTNLGYTGSGQTIAILIDSVPLDSDLTSFWAKNGIAQSLANITKIAVNGSLPTDADGEATLDVEWSSSAAPAAQVRVYATGELSFTDIDKGLQRIISDLPGQPSLHQLSISLGLGETYLTGSSEMQTEAQYFATLASKGVSVFVASGDAGSNPDDTGHNDASDPGPLQVEYEASDPSVTGVGGTVLKLDSSTGSVVSETAWADSGGGVSRYFSKPTWQTGAGVPTGTKRFVPDVALVAADTTAAYLYFQGQAEGVAGTSWSSPTWAGFAALINEARAKHSLASMGLMNPLLYPLVGSSNFRDITSGSNGKYSAGTGYDRVTGLGTPNLAVLLPTLGGTSTGAPSLTAFSPTSGAAGTTVTITGTNLDRTTSVTFSGISAAFTANGSTSLTATVPAKATSGPIAVVTSAGSATSASAFTVLTAAVANDNFAAAQSISGTTGTTTGSNVGATKETGEPDHAGNSGGGSVWYLWTAPSAGTYTFDTGGSSFDTLLAIYTGSAVGSLTEVASNDDAGTGVTSSVSFAAAANTAYAVAVDGHNGQTGTLQLNWARNSTAPTINNFVPASGAAGTVVAINGANLDGTTAVTFSGVAASFTVVSTTQISATVPAGAVTGVINVATLAGNVSSAGVFSVTNPPANDNWAAAQVLSGASGMVTGTNVGATKENGEPTHAGNPGGHSVWYLWTAPATRPVSFNTFGSSFDTLLAVYTGSAVNALSQVAADDNAGSSFNSVVTFSATAGQNYYIAIDGSSGVIGNLALNWNSNIAAPAITSFTPTTGSAGTTVTISGVSLSSVSAVTFNQAVAPFSVLSDTQLTAVVPAGATTGAIAVTNPAGTATSSQSFTVGAPSNNDDFANAATLPATGTVTGSNVGATKEAHEPDHAGNAGGASVWWSWTAPNTGTYTITTLGSSFDTVLGVYTGNAVGSLAVVASNDDDPSGGHTSLVTFTATAGTIYRIAVDGFGGVTGDILLSVLADNAGTIFSTGFESAEAYSTSLALAGQNGWMSSGPGGNGIVANFFDGEGQQGYLGHAGGRSNSPTFVWKPLNYTPAAGDVVTFQVTMQVMDSTNRNYDDFEWQVYNQAGKNLFSIDFNNGTLGIGYYLDDGAAVHDTGYQFGNSSAYILQVTMDFARNLWSASVDGTVVAKNQPITTKKATLDLGDIDAAWSVLGRQAGTNYLLFDNFTVRNTGNTAPHLLLQPQDQTASQGTTVTFRAVAAGTQPITYQWRKDGVAVAGATEATLTLANVQSGDEGTYTAVVTNVAGSVTTGPATLTVNQIQAPNLQPYQPRAWSDRLIVSANATATTDDAVLLAGETLYAGVAVINNGPLATAGSFRNAIYVDGVLAASWTPAGALEASATASQTGILLGALSLGSHEVQIVVDADNVIAEANEGDNSYTKTITVRNAANYVSIAASATPPEGGSVSGGGAIALNKSVTLVATPAAGYSFINWTDGTRVVATSASYTFKATLARSLVANFALTASLPNVQITSPASGAITVHNSVALVGTASGTAGIDHLAWRDSLGGSGTASGTTAWTIEAVPLKAGLNIITVTATDLAGHTVAAAVKITRRALGAFAGTYTGLLATPEATPAYLGQARFTLGAGGAFTAAINFQGVRTAFSGVFDGSGSLVREVTRPGLTPLTLQLVLNPTPGRTLTGTVSDGRTTADLQAVLPGYLGAEHPWPHPGRYTLLLQSSGLEAAAPSGHGYGLLTVSAQGLATLTGKMADGAVVSRSGYLAADDHWVAYASLYGARGYAAGPALFETTSAGDISGALDWLRPAIAGSVRFAAGFQTRLSLVGSSYHPGRVPLLRAGSRALELSDGTTTLQKTVTLGNSGVFTITPVGDDRLKLAVQRATGLISGSFRAEGSATVQPIAGVLLQTPDDAAGFYLNAGGGGSLEIGAATSLAPQKVLRR